MANQKQSKKPPEADRETSDQLEVTHSIDVPEINQELEKVESALKFAQEAGLREHRCRICGERDCTHYEREYIDNLEEFDSNDPRYVDREIGRKLNAGNES
jgi:hypothetical protein